uniref:Glycine N-acyltransferase-like protein n=1 Tax=Lepisosteus oculatus TaxID=7918 RepID=W5NFC6_LEPOC|nr:PREDICTED: glycine N-acyltransferase-like protein 3 [Lepisosteus oculatus]
MAVLESEQLQIAEGILRQFLPESLKVYGCLFNINRGKPHNIEVIADSWPAFKVILCRPKRQGVLDREGDFNIHSIFSRDKESLGKLLQRPGVIDWSRFSLLAGVDLKHLDVVKDLALSRNVPARTQTVVYVMTLEDSSQLRQLPEHSDAGCRLARLSPSHAELVNANWSFGGDRNSYNSVLNYISHNPSLCVLDERGKPISWILMYQHCALGLLYTLPDHRRQGHAKLLVTEMSRQLLEQGYPVYCFVEEENQISYQLFTSLGFRHKPDYRAVWFQLSLRQQAGSSGAPAL